MALATREHKRQFHSTILTAQKLLLLEALTESEPALKYLRRNLNAIMSGRSASISVASDAMVCVECFRMKGDQDLKAPCQNPRCYFYLQVPGCDPQAAAQLQRDSAMSPGPAFNKEVGCDRVSSSSVSAAGGRIVLKSATRPSQSSDFLLSQCSSGDGSTGKNMDGIWAFKPMPNAYMMSKLGQQSNKLRSQSISVGGHAAPSLMKCGPGTSCHQVNNGSSTMQSSSAEMEKSKLMRARMMSMPLVTTGMESLMDSAAVEGDLVEDAFLSSPMPDYVLERPVNHGAVGQKMVSCVI